MEDGEEKRDDIFVVAENDARKLIVSNSKKKSLGQVFSPAVRNKTKKLLDKALARRKREAALEAHLTVDDENDFSDFKQETHNIKPSKPTVKLKSNKSTKPTTRKKEGKGDTVASTTEPKITRSTTLKDNPCVVDKEASANADDPDDCRRTCHICNEEVVETSLKTHLQHCIKARFEHKKGSGDETKQDEKVTCPICDKEFQIFGLMARTKHINECIDQNQDKNDYEEEYRKLLENARSYVMACPMCGKKVQTVNSRIKHIKQCALSNKMTVEQVRNLIGQQTEEYHNQLDAGVLPYDFRPPAKQTKPKGSRKPSKFLEDVQLAKALSTSMVEFQLQDNNFNNKKAVVHKNVLKADGGKKSKQDKDKRLLLSITKEQAHERVSNHVAAHIFNKSPEDEISKTPSFKRKTKTDVSKSQDSLWSKASLPMLSEVTETSSSSLPFYVSALMPAVSVSTVVPGSKLRRCSQIPGRGKSLGTADVVGVVDHTGTSRDSEHSTKELGPLSLPAPPQVEESSPQPSQSRSLSSSSPLPQTQHGYSSSSQSQIVDILAELAQEHEITGCYDDEDDVISFKETVSSQSKMTKDRNDEDELLQDDHDENISSGTGMPNISIQCDPLTEKHILSDEYEDSETSRIKHPNYVEEDRIEDEMLQDDHDENISSGMPNMPIQLAEQHKLSDDEKDSSTNGENHPNYAEKKREEDDDVPVDEYEIDRVEHKTAAEDEIRNHRTTVDAESFLKDKAETLESENHRLLDSLSSSLLTLVNNPSYSDVFIRVRDAVSIAAHINILLARCPLILDMCTSEENGSVINLSDFSKNSVLYILNYIYGGRIPVLYSGKLKEEVTKLAQQLSLDPISKRLTQMSDSSNSLDVGLQETTENEPSESEMKTELHTNHGIVGSELLCGTDVQRCKRLVNDGQIELHTDQDILGNNNNRLLCGTNEQNDKRTMTDSRQLEKELDTNYDIEDSGLLCGIEGQNDERMTSNDGHEENSSDSFCLGLKDNRMIVDADIANNIERKMDESVDENSNCSAELFNDENKVVENVPCSFNDRERDDKDKEMELAVCQQVSAEIVPNENNGVGIPESVENIENEVVDDGIEDSKEGIDIIKGLLNNCSSLHLKKTSGIYYGKPQKYSEGVVNIENINSLSEHETITSYCNGIVDTSHLNTFGTDNVDGKEAEINELTNSVTSEEINTTVVETQDCELDIPKIVENTENEVADNGIEDSKESIDIIRGLLSYCNSNSIAYAPHLDISGTDNANTDGREAKSNEWTSSVTSEEINATVVEMPDCEPEGDFNTSNGFETSCLISQSELSNDCATTTPISIITQERGLDASKVLQTTTSLSLESDLSKDCTTTTPVSMLEQERELKASNLLQSSDPELPKNCTSDTLVSMEITENESSTAKPKKKSSRVSGKEFKQIIQKVSSEDVIEDDEFTRIVIKLEQMDKQYGQKDLDDSVFIPSVLHDASSFDPNEIKIIDAFLPPKKCKKRKKVSTDNSITTPENKRSSGNTPKKKKPKFSGIDNVNGKFCFSSSTANIGTVLGLDKTVPSNLAINNSSEENNGNECLSVNNSFDNNDKNKSNKSALCCSLGINNSSDNDDQIESSRSAWLQRDEDEQPDFLNTESENDCSGILFDSDNDLFSSGDEAPNIMTLSISGKKDENISGNNNLGSSISRTLQSLNQQMCDIVESSKHSNKPNKTSYNTLERSVADKRSICETQMVKETNIRPLHQIISSRSASMSTKTANKVFHVSSISSKPKKICPQSSSSALGENTSSCSSSTLHDRSSSVATSLTAHSPTIKNHVSQASSSYKDTGLISSPLSLRERLGLSNPFNPKITKSKPSPRKQQKCGESEHLGFNNQFDPKATEQPKKNSRKQQKCAEPSVKRSETSSGTANSRMKPIAGGRKNDNISTANLLMTHMNTPPECSKNVGTNPHKKRKGSNNIPSPFTPMAPYDDMNTPELKKAVTKIGVRPIGKKRMKELLKHVYHETHQYETDPETGDTPVKRPNQKSSNKEALDFKQYSCKQLFSKSSSQIGKDAVSTGSGSEFSASDNTKRTKTLKGCDKGIDNGAVFPMASLPSSSRDEKEDDDDFMSSQDSCYSVCPDVPEESILQMWPEEEEMEAPCTQLTQNSNEALIDRLMDFLKDNPKIYEQILMYEALELDVFKKQISDAGIRIGLARLQDFLDERCITFSMKNMSNRNNRQPQKKKKSSPRKRKQVAKDKQSGT